MAKILATDGMDKGAVEELKRLGHEVVERFYEPEELKEQVKHYDVLVVRSATKVRAPLIDEAVTSGQLKLVIRGGVGVDNIDVSYAEDKGIAVRNTPNSSSASVAELALGHMLNLARNIHRGNVGMHQGKWEKKQLKGVDIAGKTLGIIGIGRIGRALAEKADALGMTVIYYDKLGALADEPRFKYVALNELIQTADFISLHIPKADKPVLGAAEIAQMKDGVYLVNTARGNLIEEGALVEALNSGKVAGVGLDVYAEEPSRNEALITHERASLTPHVGASTVEAQQRIGGEIVSIITAFFS